MTQLQEQLLNIETEIQKAESAATSGHYHDLSHLRPAVEKFCNDLLQTPASSALPFLPRLTAVVAKIDHTAQAIRQAGALTPILSSDQEQNG